MEMVNISAIKYFTALIHENAAKGKDSVSSQMQYHNALRRLWGERIEFIMGSYAIYKSKQPLISSDDPDKKPKDCHKVQVWKIEEKQSDVNLALHLLKDALKGDIDQVVLVTNDTDLVPAFLTLQELCPNIVRGLVVPTKKAHDDQKIERFANVSLSGLAHWVRTHINEDELRGSQLPDVVKSPSGGRSSKKPYSWYARPDNLTKMIELALPVLKKEKSIMQWARKPNEWLDGKCPIDLIETEEGSNLVFKYIQDYIEDKIDNGNM